MFKKIFVFSLSILFCLTILTPAVAQLGNFKNALEITNQSAQKTGLNTSENSTVEAYVTRLTGYALSLIGIIFFVLMIYGGFKWMLAKGDTKDVETAKDTITMAIIGIIVVILAYAISQFLITRIVAAVTT
ncbi:MAG: hypothetical protein A2294_01010 [Candidatus Magasanikbacteria bacterium RIFOXYB2_FULL_38_10]|nr:MAG: hypothetical protein A2294_01010 [Candidatus Magasanikbacteria bacterium RIFOXYB2_FULL_38_10]